jgi:hypothetical protein
VHFFRLKVNENPAQIQHKSNAISAQIQHKSNASGNAQAKIQHFRQRQDTG